MTISAESKFKKTGRFGWQGNAAAIVVVVISSSPFWWSAQAADKMAPMSKEQRESMSAKGDPKSVDSMDMHKSTMKGMKEMAAMKSSGNADHDFARMMKVHHQSALDMANVELQQGKDSKLRSMAKGIITSQKKEIKEFDQWLAKDKLPMSEPMSK